jgi:hypothetical protein
VSDTEGYLHAPVVPLGGGELEQIQFLLGHASVQTPDPKQRWLTFIHNHAKVIVACDFFVAVTASFCTLYVFVIIELGTRRILHQS